ncbi:hypothetical protein ACFLVS_06970 [Chloroflexota bacterium]
MDERELIEKYTRQYLIDRGYINDVQWVKLTDDDAKNVYKKVRCCLYHTGLIDPGIIINHNMNSAMQIDGNNISINPRLLINAIERHFNYYLKKLNNPDEKQLRSNFQARFDYQHV